MLNLMACLKISFAGHVFYSSASDLLLCFHHFFPLDVKSYSELIPHGRVYAEVYQPDILDITLTWGTVIYNTLPLTLRKSLTTALNSLCIFPHMSCYDMSEK